MNKLLIAARNIYPASPIALIDIGARWGLQRPWNNFPEKHLRYFGIDADAEECKRLNLINKDNASFVYCPAAVLDKETDETLYLTEEEGCSSVYKPNNQIINRYFFKEQWKIKKEIKIRTTTLNNVFLENKIDPDFIKIDTQGSELNILKGAENHLDQVLGLELEVEFLDLYKDQPLFSDIDSFVREKGFELFDLNRYWANRCNSSKHHLNRGQIVFGDAIYFRSINSFYNLDMSLEKRKEKLLKIVLSLSLYGFFDSAIDYINHDSSPLNSEEKDALSEKLLQITRIPIWQKIFLNNKFANKLGKAFKIIGNFLSYPLNTYGWGTDYNAIDGRFPYFKRK
ncbi:MAG: FkbM family methyltransferase [Planctomycetes bacterium]|nr:FkbM family methyltransferase [Planctomycetota bacterium]